MKLIFKILSLLAAMAAGAAAATFFINKYKSKEPLDCGLYLAIGRKKLINTLNKDIEDTEARTSPENHSKIQQELEDMDWEKNEESC